MSFFLKNILITFSFCFVLLFKACVSVSPESAMEAHGIETPKQWTAIKEAQAGIDQNWIARFGDRRLEKLVDEAIKYNKDLKITASRVAQAAANARLIRRDLEPLVDLNFSGNRRKQNLIGFPLNSGGSSEASPYWSKNFGVSLDLNWELDVWGRVRAGHSAAIGGWQAAVFDEQASVSSLAAQIAKVWFALCEAKGQVALAKEATEIFQKTEKAVQERFESGETGATQLRLARIDVENTRADLSQRQQEVEQVSRQLELLLARYPDGFIQKIDASLPKLPPPPPAGLPSQLLLRRPDILAAERRLAASMRKVREAYLTGFPSFRLTGNYGTTTETLKEVLNSDFGVWSLAGNLAQPILAGGAIRAGYKLRKAEKDQGLAEFQNTVLKAFGEVERSLSIEKHLAARKRSLEKASKLAKNADKQAREEYASGTGDLLTVFNAQNRFVQARAQLLNARRLCLENRINLHLALGGDFKARKKISKTKQ